MAEEDTQMKAVLFCLKGGRLFEENINHSKFFCRIGLKFGKMYLIKM